MAAIPQAQTAVTLPADQIVATIRLVPEVITAANPRAPGETMAANHQVPMTMIARATTTTVAANRQSYFRFGQSTNKLRLIRNCGDVSFGSIAAHVL